MRNPELRNVASLLLVFFGCGVAHVVSSAPFALSEAAVESVEAGTADKSLQHNYILACVVGDVLCNKALFDVWAAKSAEFPLNKYATDANEQVPDTFKGTEVGRVLADRKTIDLCVNDSGDCLAFLVDITKAINELPRETLQLTFGQDSEGKSGTLSEASEESRIASTEAPKSSDQTPSKTVSGTLIDRQEDPFSSNGYVAQLAQTHGSAIVFRNADGDQKLADVANRPKGGKLVTLANDKILDADEVSLTYKGLVGRSGGKFFSYTVDGAFNQYNAPNGFGAASYQFADPFESGFMLLESGRSSSGFGDLTAPLGLGEESTDYVLMDIHNGQLFAIQVSTSGKEIGQGVNCRKKNAVLNICEDMRFKESLVTKLGTKNLAHYAWAVRWFRTPEAAYLVALEKTLRQVNVTDLTTGTKNNVFKRGMGISGFEANQRADGKVAVRAKLFLKWKTQDDVSQLFGAQSARVD